MRLMELLARVKVRCGAADERGCEAPCDADEEEGEDVVEDGGLVGGGGGRGGFWVHCLDISPVLFAGGGLGGIWGCDCGELEMWLSGCEAGLR